jgi:hypothetical protein
LERIREMLTDWWDGWLFYDEPVPAWLLAICSVLAAGLLFVGAALMPPAPRAPFDLTLGAIVGGGLALALLLKWSLLDDGFQVSLATAATVLIQVGIVRLGLISGERVEPTRLALLASPLGVFVLGRAWAVLAWHLELEDQLGEHREALGRLRDGSRYPDEWLLEVQRRDGDDVAVWLFDGKERRQAVISRSLWDEQIHPGRWYLVSGVDTVETPSQGDRGYREADSVLRLTKLTQRAAVPMIKRSRQNIELSYLPDIIAWGIAIAALSISGAVLVCWLA